MTLGRELLEWSLSILILCWKTSTQKSVILQEARPLKMVLPSDQQFQGIYPKGGVISGHKDVHCDITYNNKAIGNKFMANSRLYIDITWHRHEKNCHDIFKWRKCKIQSWMFSVLEL